MQTDKQNCLERMQASTTPYLLCDYHMFNCRKAKCLLPYLKQPYSVHVLSQKNSLQNILSCFLKTLFGCHPRLSLVIPSGLHQAEKLNFGSEESAEFYALRIFLCYSMF